MTTFFVLSLIILCLTWVIGYAVFCAVRSFLHMPLNLPPSKTRWARVYANVLSCEEHYKDVSSLTQKHFQLVKTYTVRYAYQGEVYTGQITGHTVHRKKAVVYCRKSCPEHIKEFIPQPPLPAEASVSLLLLAAFLLIIDILLLTMAFIPCVMQNFVN